MEKAYKKLKKQVAHYSWLLERDFLDYCSSEAWNNMGDKASQYGSIKFPAEPTIDVLNEVRCALDRNYYCRFAYIASTMQREEMLIAEKMEKLQALMAENEARRA